jgi:hypothetical protein
MKGTGRDENGGPGGLPETDGRPAADGRSGGQGRSAPAGRRRRWWWIAGTALLVTAAAAPAVWLVWGAYTLSESGRSREVPCEETISFAGAALPEHAEDAKCTTASWLDTQYEARFRMPRAEVAGWLKRHYPGVRPEDPQFCDADLCLNVQYGDGGGPADSATATPENPVPTDGPAATAPSGPAPTPAPPGGAAAVDVTVTNEDADTALVRLFAFTV